MIGYVREDERERAIIELASLVRELRCHTALRVRSGRDMAPQFDHWATVQRLIEGALGIEELLDWAVTRYCDDSGCEPCGAARARCRCDGAVHRFSCPRYPEEIYTS